MNSPTDRTDGDFTPPSDIYQPPPPPARLSAHKPLLLSLAGLAALMAFQAFLLVYWTRGTDLAPTAAAAQQVIVSRDYAELDALRSPARLLSYEFKPPTIPVPPLYHLASAALMDREAPEKAGLYVNVFFLVLLCAALWGLGRRLGGPQAGLAAAVLFSCAAGVQGLAREQTPDLTLAAWVALGYWAFLASDRFQRPLPALLTGLLVAAAQLTKWSAFVYFLPVMALGALALADKRGRVGALLALSAAVLPVLPWYRAHWPFLLPRLLEAAFGREQAYPLLTYLGGTSLGLEFPLFLAAIAGLVLNQGLRSKLETLTLGAWFLASFLFWTLLPSRDPRYIVPALAPLAVMAAALPVRRVVPALCAFQLLSAANFGAGLLPRLGFDLPGLPVAVFSGVPRPAPDWKVREILEEVQRSGAAGQEKDYLSVMDVHPRFNCATFDWERRRLGIEKVQIRYPSRNMGSFSNFVLLKLDARDVPDLITLKVNPFGSLSVAGGGAGAKPEEGAWFQQAYQALQRWGLPDGTRGVLFWRKQAGKNPFHERYAFFNYYKDETFEGRDMTVDLGEWDPDRGVHREVTITAKSLSFDGLKAANVHLVMQDLTLLPVRAPGSYAMAGGEVTQSTEDLLLNVRFMRMRRLRVLSASVNEKDAEAYLVRHANVPGVKLTGLTLDKNVAVKASVLNVLPVTAEALTQLRSDGRGLDVELKRATVAGLPVPLGLLLGDRVKMKLAFDMNLPFEVEVAPFTIENGRMRMARRDGEAK